MRQNVKSKTNVVFVTFDFLKNKTKEEKKPTQLELKSMSADDVTVCERFCRAFSSAPSTRNLSKAATIFFVIG